MQIFGVHFCHEEVLAFIGAIPFSGFFIAKVRAVIHKLQGCDHKE